ncbi:DoxX family protein [Actinocorallia aurantiaca]|uniref:DoxX family protein n=2 Tax=Actinocorallia aurantiaca TaxID=46204 RepID=A0ABP6H1V4_9ACTN
MDMDFGLLLLRLFFGLAIASHGAQKLFGWFGGFGIEATGMAFAKLGYEPGQLFAVIAGLSEFVGGLLLALGLFTPLGAAMVMGVMLNAIYVDWEKGFYMATEKPMLFGFAALALAFTGPGRYSLDHGRKWEPQGIGWGFSALALAVIAALITLLIRQ